MVTVVSSVSLFLSSFCKCGIIWGAESSLEGPSRLLRALGFPLAWAGGEALTSGV